MKTILLLLICSVSPDDTRALKCTRELTTPIDDPDRYVAERKAQLLAGQMLYVDAQQVVYTGRRR